jgi:protein arginine kinase
MVLDDLVRNPGSWLSMRRGTGIVISSRMRLARNVRGLPFPGWASEQQSIELCGRLRGVIEQLESVSNPLFFDMGQVSATDREVLNERHLISNELAEQGRGSGLIVSEDERIAVMINEEDHLRLQAISPGMNLLSVWKKVDAVDSDLEQFLDYAFSPRLGYLTACPTNIGTGLRASVMMHLSGLRLLEELGPVIKGLERLGFAVRGLLGEGTEAYGNMFQISNQVTLGDPERTIIEKLTRVVSEVVEHEQNARDRLMEDRRNYLLDQIARSFGILVHARVLESREAVDLLSGLRLGVEFGVVRQLSVARINELMLMIQPGHLQKTAGRLLDAQARDELRADMVRKRLKGVTVSG